MAFALALFFAVSAAVIGGFQERSEVRDCNYEPCRIFHEYGWPSAWRTDEPPERIQTDILWGYNGDGVALVTFGFTVMVWFLVAMPLVLLASVAMDRVTRSLRGSRSASM